MSEYWKSTPKYWCKHCSTYVKDTPFERKQHENTGKHQGNLKRFLRGIQNEHEQTQRDKERAKAEVDRLNKVVGGGVASTGSSPSGLQKRTVQKSATNGPSAADQKRQWAQLAEMGIEVPNDFRAEMAMPGKWEAAPLSAEHPADTVDSLSTGVRKRKFDGQEEDSEPGSATVQRGWGSTTRRYPKQDDADLDALLSGPVVKKEKEAKIEPSLELETSHAPKVEPQVATQEIEDRSAAPEAEPDDHVVLADITKGAEAANVKIEGADSDATSPQGDSSRGNTAPVFKKRKAKSQASTAVRLADG